MHKEQVIYNIAARNNKLQLVIELYKCGLTSNEIYKFLNNLLGKNTMLHNKE